MRISTKFISCLVVLWAAIAYAAADDGPAALMPAFYADSMKFAYLNYAAAMNVGPEGDNDKAAYVGMHRCPVHLSSIYLRNMYDFLILVLQGYVS